MGQSQTETNYKEVLETFYGQPYWIKYQKMKENNPKFKIQFKNSNDNSIVFLSPSDMDRLNLFRGDTIVVFTKLKMIYFVVLQDDEIPEGLIVMSKNAAKHCKEEEGNIVYLDVDAGMNIKFGTEITISPLNPMNNNAVFIIILGDYFRESYRPVTLGETFEVLDNDFIVTSIKPRDCVACIVAPDTTINIGEIIYGNVDNESFTFIEDIFSSNLFSRNEVLDLKFSFK
jgi:hypothetical protein